MPTPRSRFHLLLAATSVLLAGVPAFAMSVVERSFPELAARAEQIVVGTVTKIAAGLDDRGGPLTLVSFTDLVVLKGEVSAPFVLELTGGTAADGMAVHIPDMPSFTVGERAVLFVAGNGRDLCPLVGVWQGRFRVIDDPDSGRQVVERHDGTRITGFVGDQLRSAPRASARSSEMLSLEDFLDLIREELAHPTEIEGAGQ